MKTQRLLLIVVIFLILLVAINFIFYIWQPKQKQIEFGNTEANDTAIFVERVKNSEERARMEKYLAEYQKGQKVVRTIVAPSGEIIDYIDLYTQAGVRMNKIEKNEIQFAPTIRPESEKEDSGARAAAVKTPDMLFMLTGDSCPKGAIPVRRLTMETLTRFETLDDFFRKGHGYIHPPCGGDGTSAGHAYAHAARSVANWGGESILNVWSPYVEKSNEFSLSQIWVVRGSGNNRETVEAGWQVYKDLYGDWRAHLFIYFTPDNYGSGGGYNLTTGAFVQVSNTVYIGGGFTNYSSLGGQQWEMKLLLYKDGTNGSWWLRYGDTWVGYWPRSRFDANGLRDQADRVDFGGEIVDTRTDNRHTRTDMGSGHWPYETFAYAAYQRNIKYVDVSNYYRNATGLSPSHTNNMCYDIDLYETTGSWGVYFYFGGSGYNTYCP